MRLARTNGDEGPEAALPGRGGLSRGLIRELLLPSAHPAHVRRHRAEVVAGRVRLISAIFAVAAPLWIPIDAAAFAWPVWGYLAGLRLLAGAVFALLALLDHRHLSPAGARLRLVAMLAVPPVFYLAVWPLIGGEQLGLFPRILADAYGLLPAVVVAGLCIFPLTAVEVVVLALPVLAVTVGAAVVAPDQSIPEIANTLWLVILIAGVALISGVSQLRYMLELMDIAAHDPLTGAFTRRSGEEALDLHFRLAERTAAPLAVVFLDLDAFKRINDDHGHEAGDRALQDAAAALHHAARRSDILVRWGGEEFVLVLPNTDAAGADVVLRRLAGNGLGRRPDGSPMTASVGVSERMADGMEDWPHLVQMADARMYLAKQSGRNGVVSTDELLGPFLRGDGERAVS